MQSKWKAFLNQHLVFARPSLCGGVVAGTNQNQMKDLSLVNDAAAAIGSFYQYQCIEDIADFGCNMSAFLDLSGSNEANIADLASECVILLLKVAAREATTGLLSSASTVTSVLESCRLRCQGPEMRVYGLVLQRLLHALSLACQEYGSQAMILSISGAEITKIETLASNMRSSTIPCLADAASGACLELRRLPHCMTSTCWLFFAVSTVNPTS